MTKPSGDKITYFDNDYAGLGAVDDGAEFIIVDLGWIFQIRLDISQWCALAMLVL